MYLDTEIRGNQLQLPELMCCRYHRPLLPIKVVLLDIGKCNELLLLEVLLVAEKRI
jgi:hypothetical protein